MIGGWRDQVPGQETGTFDLQPNSQISQGLMDFVGQYYNFNEPLTWEYQWTGLMASSSSGFPYLGPLENRIYLCSAYTGHGYSWAHHSAKLVSQMITGEKYDPVASYFNPRKI